MGQSSKSLEFLIFLLCNFVVLSLCDKTNPSEKYNVTSNLSVGNTSGSVQTNRNPRRLLNTLYKNLRTIIPESDLSELRFTGFDMISAIWEDAMSNIEDPMLQGIAMNIMPATLSVVIVILVAGAAHLLCTHLDCSKVTRMVKQRFRSHIFNSGLENILNEEKNPWNDVNYEISPMTEIKYGYAWRK